MPPSSTKPLTRTITAEEALDGFLRVEKAWLKQLPAPGTPFQLKLGKSQLKVQIATESCSCRKEKKAPHEHYRISLPLVSLVEGSEATLRPVKDDLVVLEAATV